MQLIIDTRNIIPPTELLRSLSDVIGRIFATELEVDYHITRVGLTFDVQESLAIGIN